MASKFKDKLAKYFGIKDRLGAAFVWLSAALALANLAVVLAFVVPRWGELVFLRLHYTVSLGIDWIGDWRYIFVYPGLAIAIFAVNGWLAGQLASRQRRLGLIVMAMTGLLLVMLLTGIILVISLNG